VRLGPALRAHLLLTLVIIVSRIALSAAGLRFEFALDWMWLADPADLRDRLAETLSAFHAFPPGMSLLTGILLKIAGAQADTLALAVFWVLGLILANALNDLGRAAGLTPAVALAMTVAFMLSPPAIYFEHLYLYEWPVTTLLCGAAALFSLAVRRQSVPAWFAFFCVCAAIGLTRSTFHLVWFVGMVGMCALVCSARVRRRALVAAAAPALLLVALYLKNLVLFGEFAGSTFGPASLTLVTVARLPEPVRREWIEQRRLSPYAAVSVYAAPREYVPFFGSPDRAGWAPQLTRLEQPTTGAPNYNHWFLLEAHRARMRDAWTYLESRPLDYAGTVMDGVRDMFGPSTEWHPRDRTDRSPHARHRQVLGRYEAIYTRVVHAVPTAPFGLYVFLPFVMAWTLWRVRQLVGSGDRVEVARGALLGFCIVQIGYVVAASTMLTHLEMARYRFQVEPFIWLLATACVVEAIRMVRGRRGADSAGPT
jgi:hypothetical protein